MNDKFAAIILVSIFIFCVGYSIAYSIKTEIKSNKPIIPTITISCTNSVCDTTYIYKGE